MKAILDLDTHTQRGVSPCAAISEYPKGGVRGSISSSRVEASIESFGETEGSCNGFRSCAMTTHDDAATRIAASIKCFFI
jgi:hypothetical protein